MRATFAPVAALGSRRSSCGLPLLAKHDVRDGKWRGIPLTSCRWKKLCTCGKTIFHEAKLAVPLFGLSLALNFVNFDVIWRYFGWANQTLAAVALWTGAVFLARRRSRWWIAFVPAVFMKIVTTSYILVEDVGFGLNQGLGAALGVVVGLMAAAFFLGMLPRLEPEEDKPAVTGHPTDAERTAESLAC
jgi:hypothetical protein